MVQRCRDENLKVEVWSGTYFQSVGVSSLLVFLLGRFLALGCGHVWFWSSCSLHFLCQVHQKTMRRSRHMWSAVTTHCWLFQLVVCRRLLFCSERLGEDVEPPNATLMTVCLRILPRRTGGRAGELGQYRRASCVALGLTRAGGVCSSKVHSTRTKCGRITPSSRHAFCCCGDAARTLTIWGFVRACERATAPLQERATSSFRRCSRWTQVCRAQGFYRSSTRCNSMCGRLRGRCRRLRPESRT